MLQTRAEDSVLGASAQPKAVRWSVWSGAHSRRLCAGLSGLERTAEGCVLACLGPERTAEGYVLACPGPVRVPEGRLSL